MTLLNFFDNRVCDKKRVVAVEEKRQRIPWKKHPEYDEILRKHYFALGGKNYAKKVLNEININGTPKAVQLRVETLGLYKELQRKKLEEIINKNPISQKQRSLIRKWKYLTDLFYSDRNLYLRAGIYEIRNKVLDIQYIGMSLILFYRFWYGYIHRNKNSERFDSTDERYVIKLVEKYGIDHFELRVDYTFHNFDDYNKYLREDGSLNSTLLKNDMKHRESLLIHKRLNEGVRLVNQSENPNFAEIVLSLTEGK